MAVLEQVEADRKLWTSGLGGARILGISSFRIAESLRSAGVRTKTIPGRRPVYLIADIEALRDRSIKGGPRSGDEPDGQVSPSQRNEKARRGGKFGR